MSKELDKLKKLLEEKEEKKAAKAAKPAKPARKAYEDEIDVEALGKIVSRMKDKYAEEGIAHERAAAKTKDLRGVVYGERELRIKTGSPRELALMDNSTVRFLGKLYLKLQSPVSALSNLFGRGFGRKLEGDLLAAGMNYSVEQYLTLAAAATLVVWLISLAFMILLFVFGKLPLMFLVLLAIIIPLLSMGMALVIPSSRASKRALEIERQLPFALRHMSIEIRAGVGIYKTMESVANAGYGELSKGFKWVLLNIEKGVPTEEAIEAWAERTRSEGLRRMASHLVRALRTGGNLSDIMITIAEDVSFEHKMRIASFAEKLNLMSLFLMMIAIVVPVMITILTTIGSNPTIKQYMAAFAFFTPSFLMLIYFVIVPALIFIFIYFIRSSDPG